MEVSARWKRTWKGEVVMTIVVPESVIDTELYVKTPKGAHWHPDGPLDVMFLEKDMELLPSPQHPDQGKDEEVQTAEGW